MNGKYSQQRASEQVDAGRDYQDFLDSLTGDGAGSAPAKVDSNAYSYGSDEPDWGDFNEWDADTDDYQDDDYVEEFNMDDFNYDIDGYCGGESANANKNGLTNEEIYGVWNRPQSPSTGSLGQSSGFGGGAIPDVDLSVSEDDGIISRIGGWVKDTFCFWCD